MNQDAKAKWIAALRSGEYEQGKYYLHRGESYCCLGVLCDLHAKETNHEWSRQDTWNEEWRYYDEVRMLPQIVQDWIGGSYGYLAQLNDRGATFNDIASLIEEKT